MRRSARLSDQPRRTYFEDNGDEVKKPSKLTKNDEEIFAMEHKSESESDQSEEVEFESLSETGQTTSASPSTSSPRSRRSPKSGRKSRLCRRKKLPAFICEEVPVLSDISFWRQLVKARRAVTSKTPVSSLVYLKLSNVPVKQYKPFEFIDELDNITLFTFSPVVDGFAKSDTKVFKLSDERIISLCWLDEQNVIASSESEVFIVPEGKKGETGKWGGIVRLSIHRHSGLLAAICGDFHTRIIQYNQDRLSVVGLIPEYKCRARAVEYLSDEFLVAVGYEDGYLIVWNWKTEQIVQLLPVSSRPICSLAKCSKDDRTVFVGSLDPKLYKVDIRLGRTEVLTSSLASNITVSFSNFDGVLYADNEHHCRFINFSEGEPRPRPLGTFDSSVWSMAGSPFHNVIAISSANGAIHLSWIETDEALLILEKCILKLSENLAFDDNPETVSVPNKDVSKLYDPKVGVSCVSWCPSQSSPGLLSASYLSGMVAFIPCDRQILY